MDVYEIFRDDNARILDLAESLKHVPVDNPAGRLQLLQETQVEVVAHNAAEERVLFPTLLDDPATHDAAMAAHHENHGVETLLVELTRIPTTDQRFTHKAQLLADRLQEHVQRLNEVIYPSAQERFSGEEAEELASRALDEKKEARRKLQEREGR